MRMIGNHAVEVARNLQKAEISISEATTSKAELKPFLRHYPLHFVRVFGFGRMKLSED
jgi:hypothetical protein